MSSDNSCVCPSQQPLPYLYGIIDALRRTVGGCGFPLQSLANVHIYVPDHRGYDMRIEQESRFYSIQAFRFYGIFILNRKKVVLEPWEAEDDLVSWCTRDEEGNILLMNVLLDEGEWCGDVFRILVVNCQGLGPETERR
jgi:hypothetical protein